MTPTIPIKLPGWLRLLFVHEPNDLSRDTTDESFKKDLELQSMHDVTDYVSKSLVSLADRDVISSCRIHREYGKLKLPFNKSRDERSVYLSYLWEGAEKIIETARHISSNPNYRLDFDMKSELNVLANSITDLGMLCKDFHIDDARNKLSTELDFIRHTIDVRSKNMKHEHFNDGTLQYSYLTLLYHLHSFLNAASRLDIFRYNQKYAI